MAATRCGWVELSACGLAAVAMIACSGEETPQQPAAAWTVEETPNPAIKRPKPGDPPLPAVVVAEALPPDFPVDVPQYPGAKVKASRSMPGRGGMTVSLAAGDTPDKIISFYSDTFAAQGWATDIRRTPEGSAVFAEKDNRSASALVRVGGGETLIDIIVVER
jgi:hypothetical protein